MKCGHLCSKKNKINIKLISFKQLIFNMQQVNLNLKKKLLQITISNLLKKKKYFNLILQQETQNPPLRINS